MHSKRSSVIQPRPTKASMLRQQQPTRAAATVTKEETSSSSSNTNRTTTIKKPNVKASEGVRAFMAAQRAAAAARKNTTDSTPEPEPPKRRVMTGAERYSFDERFDRDAAFGTEPAVRTDLKLQTIIRQAKSSGKLNISNRNLKEIPNEVWSMYHVDPNKIVVDFSANDDAWYDFVELSKFIATDNSITELDERLGQEFTALTLIDLRSNCLSRMPDSLAQLQSLTTLVLARNQFTVFPPSILGLPKLKQLDLEYNQLKELPTEIGNLSTLETLNLANNELEALPEGIGKLTKLRKLLLNNNKIAELPAADCLDWQNLEELFLNKNRLHVLFHGATSVITLPKLLRLDARQNSMTQLAQGSSVQLPNLKELLLAYNQLASDDALTLLLGAPTVQTLDISSNLFANIPDQVLSLANLERLDVSSNHIRVLRPDLGKLEHLTVLNWEGNPLKSAPRNVSMAELIDSLRSKMSLNEGEQGVGDLNARDNKQVATREVNGETRKPTVSHASVPAETPQLLAKASGTLNLERKDIEELDKNILTEANMTPATLLLGHNKLVQFPASSLDCFAATLVNLNLEHNRLTELRLTGSSSPVFSSLKTLNVSNNRIASLIATSEEPWLFPQLKELHINYNALTSLPLNLTSCLQNLKTLRASNNKIDALDARSLENLEIIDLSNNEISQLSPEIGRITTIKELLLFGNRFRVPRPAVLDQGTGAVMEFLRRRLN